MYPEGKPRSLHCVRKVATPVEMTRLIGYRNISFGLVGALYQILCDGFEAVGGGSVGFELREGFGD